MKYLYAGIILVCICSCKKDNLDNNNLDLLLKQWMQISPKPMVNSSGLPVSFLKECTKNDCPYDPSVRFEMNGKYTREIYYRLSNRRWRYEKPLQFLTLTGTWTKNKDKIKLSPGNIIMIDKSIIKSDSIFYIMTSEYRGIYEKAIVEYYSNITDVFEEWDISKLTDDSLIINSINFNYKFICDE